jgi:hypothetical protein
MVLIPVGPSLLVAILAAISMSACQQRTPVSASCPATLPGWDSPQTGQAVRVTENEIRVLHREIFWNGEKVNGATLDRYVKESKALNPIPFLIFDPSGADDCDYATQIRDLLNRAGCNEGGCGQGSRDAFRHAPFKHYIAAIP